MEERRLREEIRVKIIARAWKDDAFKNKLLASPKEAFREYGIEMPDNVAIKVICEEANQSYFILPAEPVKLRDLSETELNQLAAGGEASVKWLMHFCPTPKCNG